MPTWPVPAVRRALLAAILERQSTGTANLTQIINEAMGSVGRALGVVPVGDVAGIVGQSAAARAARGTFTAGMLTRQGRTYLYAVVPQGKQAVVLLRPYGRPLFDWRPWTGTVLLICVLAAAAAAGASLLVARQITRPVARLAKGLAELTSGSSPAPLVVEGAGELRRLATSFNDMAEQLRHAREAERSFLLSVSHELKTPITAVRGYAEGLADDAVPVQEAARFIEAESRRLERLVQDLLDLARLDQRTFTVRLCTVDLADTVREVARRYERQAACDGIDLRIQATPGSAASGDPDRVAQVVSNLTENALRNVPEGGWVLLTTGPGRIEVADSGPGLSTDELPHAFERFYLHSRYRLRRHVGTGLGLAIVRELAEAMGGTVSVESPQGGGTTFTLSLPLSAGD